MPGRDGRDAGERGSRFYPTAQRLPLALRKGVKA